MKPVRRGVAGLTSLRTRQQLNHRWLPMWRTNVELQILHFAYGSVYGDKECHSELPSPLSF